MSPQAQTFWVVLRDPFESGGYTSLVTKTHATEDEAKAEARRLARKERKTFYVLQSVARYRPVTVALTEEQVQAALEKLGLTAGRPCLACQRPERDLRHLPADKCWATGRDGKCPGAGNHHTFVAPPTDASRLLAELEIVDELPF